jgi:signal transduction histidine kinase
LNASPRLWLRLFAAVVLVLAWSAIGFEIREAREDAEQDWVTNLGNITRAAGEHTMRVVANIDQDLKFVRNLYLRDGDRTDLHSLAKIGGVDQFYVRLGILGADGVYQFSDRAMAPTSHRDTEMFGAQLASGGDKLMISRPEISQFTGRTSIQFTRRITASDGRFLGVVVAEIDATFFKDLYAELDLGKNGFAALSSEAGMLLARREDGVFSSGKDVSAAPLFTTLRGKAEGNFYNTALTDSMMRLYSYKRLPETGLIVVVAVARSHVFERADGVTANYVMMGTIGTVLLLLFTIAFDRLLTRQEATLQALRASQVSVNAANQAKSDFLASMSHELRTPLNGILGFAEIIARKSQEEKIRRQAGIIQSSGKHLLALVNSILDLAKVEAGKMEVHAETINLPHLVEEVAQIHTVTAVNKGLEFAVHAQELPEQVRCDATLLRQVLNNLVSNAIKFTEQGGVTLAIRQLAPAGDGQAMLRFEVRDTGMGIPQEALQTVFEKFHQVDQSATRAHQGTGLGLALAKQLVELMGGRIGLASTEGEGTTFYFTLPVGLAVRQEAAGGIAGTGARIAVSA